MTKINGTVANQSSLCGDYGFLYIIADWTLKQANLSHVRRLHNSLNVWRFAPAAAPPMRLHRNTVLSVVGCRGN